MRRASASWRKARATWWTSSTPNCRCSSCSSPSAAAARSTRSSRAPTPSTAWKTRASPGTRATSCCARGRRESQGARALESVRRGQPRGAARFPSAALPRRAVELRRSVPQLCRALRRRGETYRAEHLAHEALALFEVPVEDEMREAVDERPRRRRGELRLAAQAGERALQARECRARLLLE